MNIWAWVREAKARLRSAGVEGERLAQLMQDLPSAAVDEAHARVDAMVPEALALARELDEPWVELFIRHWNMQSRVLHRRRAGEELAEAVSLLDFASGSRTKPCPQSVCAVQDLAVCYAIRDGPGYVPERLAVARETLERIDPTWACYDCISAEYYSALFDDGRLEDALAFIDGQIARAAEHGEFEIGFNTRLNRSHALLELGRPADALAELEQIRNPSRYGRSRLMAHRQRKLAIVLALGRVEDALRLHPPLSAVIGTGGHLRNWVDNLVALVEVGAIANTPRVGRELLAVQGRFVECTAYWDTAKTALVGARLAVARGAREVARLLLRDLDEVLPKLRRPKTLVDGRARIEAGLDDLSEPALDLSEPALDDPERILDRLSARAGEDGEPPTLELAAALRGVGRPAMARALLEAKVDVAGGSADAAGPVVIELAETLLAEGDHDALERLLAPADTPEPGGSEREWLRMRWILGQSLRARGLLERAQALDEQTLSHAPSMTPVRLRLAATARARRDWAAALAAYEHAATELEPGDIDWDRMTMATILGRWDVVRRAGARLDVELPGQGSEPVLMNLGVVRCEFVEASGRRERQWARRESPCAARIIEIALPGDPQHFRDWVVIEPVDLDAHLRSETSSHRPCFEVVEIVESGGYESFLLRGFDPGEDAVDELRREVRAGGDGFERISAVGRSAKDPRVDAEDAGDDGAQVPTLAILVARAPDRTAQQLRATVARVTAGWELPLLGPDLDDAAGEPEAAARARVMLERWQP